MAEQEPKPTYIRTKPGFWRFLVGDEVLTPNIHAIPQNMETYEASEPEKRGLIPSLIGFIKNLAAVDYYDGAGHS